MEITITRKQAEIMVKVASISYRLELASQQSLAEKMNAETDYLISELFIERANEVRESIAAWIETGKWLMKLRSYFSNEPAAVSVNCPSTAAPRLLSAYNKAQRYG